MNQSAFFHDMTMDYLRPAEPDVGRITDFRFRCAHGEASSVLLLWEKEHRRMKLQETDNGFDYYDISVNIGKDPFRYYFEITGKDGEVWRYDKRGACREVMESMKFMVIPGFSTPAWAKGAVMYQIFVDRFCNGDPYNDVMNGEYSYNGFSAKKVDNWNSYPDPKTDFREFYGGDLQGVINKLDYLKDLGIDVIYFNPLFVSPSSHKYDIQDYDHIDPHFGKILEDDGDILPQFEKSNKRAQRYITRVTNKRNLDASDRLFAKLVSEAHKRDIKVILDGVFNHCGSFNKWLDRERIYEDAKGYEKGAYVSADSPYRNYFSFSQDRWPYNPSYDGWWGYDTLPKLNYEGSKALEDYIISIGRKWVSEPYNADGWRLDVAADLGHSREYNHSFWQRFRKEVKDANPEAIILAEHYGACGEWLQGNEWDTVMNYDAFMEPLTWFLTGMEKHSDEYRHDLLGNIDAFWNAMYYNSAKMTMPSRLISMNELSNHDHSRFLTRTNHVVGRVADKGPEAANRGVNMAVMREAVLIQMTWVGAPTVYYGDEAGVCGFTDPDNRRTYPWGHEDMELVNYHRDVIKMHKENEEFLQGSLRILYKDYNVIAYGRFTDSAQSVIIINNNDYEKEMEIKFGWQTGAMSECVVESIMYSDFEGYNTNRFTYAVERGRLRIKLRKYCGIVLKVVEV